MINVTDAFKAKMAETRAFNYAATVTFPDESTMSLTGDDLNMSGSGISASPGSSSLPVGGAICRQLTLALVNSDDRYANVDFVGAKIQMEISLEVEDSGQTREEAIDLGEYTVTEPEQYGATVTVIAYDDFWMADISYTPSGTFPMTARALFIECCYAAGLSPQTTSFENYDFNILAAPQNVTVRQVIGMIAMLAGGNAVCLNGGVYIVTYDVGGFANNRYHVFSEHYNLTISTDDVTITGIQAEVDGNQVLYGTAGYVLLINNQLIAGAEAEAVRRIGSILVGMTLRPFTADLVSYPLAEIGDACYIDDFKGNRYQGFVTDIEFGFWSYTTIKCTAESAVRNAAKGGLSAAQLKTLQESRRAMRTTLTAYDAEVQRLASLIANAFGAFETKVQDASGGITYYMHDKPTLAASTKIWRRNADGFTVSSDGGVTWNAGMDAYGNAALNILSVIGLTANWINAGALTVTDNNGNTIFQADITNKTVYLNGGYVMIGSKSATQAVTDAETSAKAYTDAQITTVNGTITTRVAAVDAAAQGYANTAESNAKTYASTQITQTATEINSTVATKVGKSEIISQINQSAETVKILASKINLNGAVTMNSTGKKYIEADLGALAFADQAVVDDSDTSSGYNPSPIAGWITTEKDNYVIHDSTGAADYFPDWYVPSLTLAIKRYSTFRIRYANSATSYVSNGEVMWVDGSDDGKTFFQKNTFFSAPVRVNSSVVVSGTKSRVVDTSDYSSRLLYAYEMPSPVFGDIGEGVIGDDGCCYVMIDPVFAETVTLTHYQVFLQAYGDGALYVAERHPGYFVVRGIPGLSFGWEIKAKQKDFDQMRLEDPGMATTKASAEDYGASAIDHITEIYSERGVET